MNPPRVPEKELQLVRLWIERARENSLRCNLCLRISRENPTFDGELKGFRVFRVEFSPDAQFEHLAACVWNESPGA